MVKAFRVAARIPRLAASIGLVLVCCCNPAFAQEPFGFKADNLRESISEFKDRYRHVAGGLMGPPCSDAHTGMEPKASGNGVVMCRTRFPLEFNDVRKAEPETIANVPITEPGATYEFLNGELFRVVVLFPSEEFPKVREALICKYGAPAATNKPIYQSFLGATMRGDTELWQRSRSFMVIAQFAGYSDSSAFVIYDAELSQRATSLQALSGGADL